MTIEEMQNAVHAAGYQWVEHVFPEGDVYVKVAKSEEAYTLLDIPNAATMGWGRFDRDIAWEGIYRSLVLQEKGHWAMEETDRRRSVK